MVLLRGGIELTGVDVRNCVVVFTFWDWVLGIFYLFIVPRIGFFGSHSSDVWYINHLE